MHRYGPAPPQQGARLGIWPLAIVLFLLGPHLGAVLRTAAPGLTALNLTSLKLPDLQAVARPKSPHPDRGRATHSTARAERAVRFAVAQVGKPYAWGAEGPNSFDCSGLTWAAWQHAGVSIPRTAGAQLEGLPRVHGKLRPGDLVIYRTNGPTRRHVAMVVAPRRIVEARGAGIPVRVTRLRGGWLGAVRP
jgi:cell wall-associated NlpC family hydrolase